MSLTRNLSVSPVPSRMGSDRSRNSENLTPPVVIRTQGEIEAAIGAALSRFEQEYMGRGPKCVQIHLIGALLVCRLHGVLTAAEHQLAKSIPAMKGRDLIKQVRTQLIEAARPVLEALVEETAGVSVVSLHYDISTVTGEEVVLFTLAECPQRREVKRR